MLGLSVGVFAALAATVLIGALVQGVVGLGVGLVFAPVLAIAEPHLVPALPLCMGVITPLATLLWERRGIAWPVVGWTLGARLVGTAAGVWIVVHVSVNAISVGLAVMVLLAVAVSLHSVRVPDNRAALVAAGLTTGVTGTATSIGGPPIALVLQRRDPRELRPTLAVFFCLGAAASLVGLAIGGEVSGHVFGLAGTFVPGVLVGVWAGAHLRARLPREQIRLAMLTVCAASAVVLLVRSLG